MGPHWGGGGALEPKLGDFAILKGWGPKKRKKHDFGFLGTEHRLYGVWWGTVAKKWTRHKRIKNKNRDGYRKTSTQTWPAL